MKESKHVLYYLYTTESGLESKKLETKLLIFIKLFWFATFLRIFTFGLKVHSSISTSSINDL